MTGTSKSAKGEAATSGLPLTKKASSTIHTSNLWSLWLLWPKPFPSLNFNVFPFGCKYCSCVFIPWLQVPCLCWFLKSWPTQSCDPALSLGSLSLSPVPRAASPLVFQSCCPTVTPRTVLLSLSCLHLPLGSRTHSSSYNINIRISLKSGRT